MHTMQAPPVVARDGFIGAGVYMCVCVMLMPPFWLATLCWGSAVSKELAPCISATGVPVAEMRQEAGELSCTSSCWISVACSEAFCRVYVLSYTVCFQHLQVCTLAADDYCTRHLTLQNRPQGYYASELSSSSDAMG